MESGYTAYVTYGFSYDSGDTSIYGYSDTIHCNYVKSIKIDTTSNIEFNLHFNSSSDFKFLSTIGESGYTTNKIYVLLQIVNNEDFIADVDIRPDSEKWKIIDVTSQITDSGFTTGNSISASNIINTIFKITMLDYNNASYYNLDYLNYPLYVSGTTNQITDPLCFGDETYFIGNVTTSIEAIAYSTDLAINLPLGQFNSTTNNTWDGISSVSISEIGIYDVNKNLVGIAKLNNPITKDSTIARTLVFGLDF